MIINQSGGGAALPTLTNPAAAENIESGFQAVDGLGNLLEGILVKTEILEGTLTGSGSITLDDGRTGSCLSGLPVGKKNVFACALESYSSKSTMYHILFIDGKIFTMSSYRQHDYFGDNTTTNYTLDSSKGKINSASTAHFPSGVTFKYFAW